MKVSSARLAALIGAAALLALSCREPAAPQAPPLPASPQASLLGLLNFTGLLRCSPLPSDSVTQTVGPAGGVINVGAHSLSIPAGALDSSVTITAVAPSDSVNRIQFQPQGLVFNQAASLTMSYANCNPMTSLLSRRITYTDDLLTILEYLVSVDDRSSRTVTGDLHHFSDYALAW
jgi:hypothetical protein